MSHRSTAIIASSLGRTSSSLSPAGVDSTGLPATMISALICPSPGVAISSAMHDTGTWPRKAQLVHEAVFPDLGPEAPADDFVAEITRLCRGALRMYQDPAVREAIPGLMIDLLLRPRATPGSATRLPPAPHGRASAPTPSWR